MILWGPFLCLEQFLKESCLSHSIIFFLLSHLIWVFFFCHVCDLYFFCLEEIFSMFIRMIYLGIMNSYVCMNLLLYPTRISFQPISFCLSSFGLGTFMLKNIKESQQLFSKILGCNAIFIVRVMLA